MKLKASDIKKPLKDKNAEFINKLFKEEKRKGKKSIIIIYMISDSKGQELKNIERPIGLKHHDIYSTNMQYIIIEHIFETNIKNQY